MKLGYLLLATTVLGGTAFAADSVTVTGTINKVCSVTVAAATPFALTTTSPQALPDITAKSNDPGACTVLKVSAANGQLNGGMQTVQYNIAFGSTSLPSGGALTPPWFWSPWNPMVVNSPNMQGFAVNNADDAITGYKFHWTIALTSVPYAYGSYAETFLIDIG